MTTLPLSHAAATPFRRAWLATALAGVALLASAALAGCGTPADAAEAYDGSVPVRKPADAIVGQEVAVLTDAPNVPAPITRTHATKVIVNLDVIEKTAQIADSVEYP